MAKPLSVRDRLFGINYTLKLADHELIEHVQEKYALKSRSEALAGIINEWALATGHRSPNAEFIQPATAGDRN